MIIRGQGRPSREAGTVGPQKIIDDIREALRADLCVDLSRKSFASAIGVTPALISYYFAEKDSLLEQIVTPVIEAYRQAIARVVTSEVSRSEKLRSIISTLAGLYGKDRKILGIYQKLEDSHPDDYSECRAITAILSEFFEDLRGAQASSMDAAALHGAVRGMCDLAERIGAEATEGGAELIYQLFAHDHGAFVARAAMPPTDPVIAN